MKIYPVAFGDLARNKNKFPLQTATKFTTVDASTTPNTSPMVYTASVVILITIPDNTVQLVLSPSTDLRVSEDPAMAHYDIISAGAKEGLAVALMQNVYILGDAASGTVRFRFVNV